MEREREIYILPKPKQVKKSDGVFGLSYDSRIVLSSEIGMNGMVYANILKTCIQTWTGQILQIVKGRPKEGDIFLYYDTELSEEEYHLVIKETGIVGTGGDGAGILYAVETLCQIVEQCKGMFSCMEIMDAPDIKHRGYYLDETRGRVLKLDYLKRVVDRLCRYKINEFQLYIEHTYLFSGLSEVWRDETPLTAEEILELDSYCRERHVELVPSLASFGHLYTLLSTKSYGELCELTDSWQQPFSFLDRMRHHTVNVTDERVLPLIKGMLEEYMMLFSSNKFNFCADETFDLGKGKSSVYAKEHGVHRMYIDYIKELCKFLVEKEKQPMFWGDIICAEPFLVKELPEEIICLTWGYAPDQKEDASCKMSETGVKQYLCPGVSGWNQWINLIESSYQNIVRMCSYAEKYHAIGILNTDWGDFGHVNHPEYSIPGMIYGAAFSWNHEVIPLEEINQQIARVEFHDSSESFVNLLAKLPQYSLFTWWDAVMYYEVKELGEDKSKLPSLDKVSIEAEVKKAEKELREITAQMKKTAIFMDSQSVGILRACDITMEGMCIWNEIGVMLIKRKADKEKEAAFLLAERLESWFMHYKSLWREISKEGDLAHIAEIVFWYADLLRGRERRKRRNMQEC